MKMESEDILKRFSEMQTPSDYSLECQNGIAILYYSGHRFMEVMEVNGNNIPKPGSTRARVGEFEYIECESDEFIDFVWNTIFDVESQILD